MRPDFTKIGIYRNSDYAHRKYLLNPLAGEGNVDGIFTGNTVDSLFTKKSGAGYVFDGRFQWNNLLKHYGSDLKGLNQNTFVQIEIEKFLPELLKYVKDYAKIA